MNVQWYPGHMTKSVRAMKEQMGLIDLVIEIVDARIPYSSRNPDIEELAKGKCRMLVLNKTDLADPSVTALWKKAFESRGITVLELDARKSDAASRVKPLIREACREKTLRDKKRGIVGRPVKAMICGIPNVGKSTLINSMVGKTSAKTGNKPGVTRGNQWIQTSFGVTLLDTPGILWPKCEYHPLGRHRALFGSINDDILDEKELALELIRILSEAHPEALAGKYEISGTGDGYEALELAGTRLGMLGKGGEADLSRTAKRILDDFRNGRLGRISLEAPEKEKA